MHYDKEVMLGRILTCLFRLVEEQKPKNTLLRFFIFLIVKSNQLYVRFVEKIIDEFLDLRSTTAFSTGTAHWGRLIGSYLLFDRSEGLSLRIGPIPLPIPSSRTFVTDQAVMLLKIGRTSVRIGTKECRCCSD